MLWDVINGHRVATLSRHKNRIKTLEFSPIDNNLLASGSADGTVRFWDTKIGKERSIFTTSHTEAIETVVFNRNDTKLSSAASNCSVQIWDIQTRKKIPSSPLPQYESNSALALSQDATLFVCNGADMIFWSNVGRNGMYKRTHRTTMLSSLPTGDELRSFPHATEELTFSPDNNILAAILSHNQIVQLFDINTGTKLFSYGIDLSLSEKLIFSPDGKYLAMYGYGEHPHFLDVPTQEKIDIPKVKEIGALAFSPDNMNIAVEHPNADGIRVISLWGITPTGIEIHKEIIPEFRDGYTSKLLFSPDGKTLLQLHSSGWRDVIIIWDIDIGIELGTVSGHTKNIETLTFSHDGKTLASGSKDGTILLWDWETILTNTRENKGD